jgi:hypothetical protein
MDPGLYLQTIVNRCALLMVYHDHPDRRHLTRAEMRAEMKWLSADARRWGVSPGAVDSGMLAELRRKCDEATALRLHRAFKGEFANLLNPSPPIHPVKGEDDAPLPEGMTG